MSLYADVHNTMVPWILGVRIFDLHGVPVTDDEDKNWFYRVYPTRPSKHEYVKIGKLNGTQAVILTWGDNYAEMKRNEQGSGFQSILCPDCIWDGTIKEHATFADMIAHAQSIEWK